MPHYVDYWGKTAQLGKTDTGAKQITSSVITIISLFVVLIVFGSCFYTHSLSHFVYKLITEKATIPF